MKILSSILVAGMLLLSACDPDPVTVPVPGPDPDMTGWPRDHCGERYEPGTPAPTPPGTPCK